MECGIDAQRLERIIEQLCPTSSLGANSIEPRMISTSRPAREYIHMAVLVVSHSLDYDCRAHPKFWASEGLGVKPYQQSLITIRSSKHIWIKVGVFICNTRRLLERTGSGIKPRTDSEHKYIG